MRPASGAATLCVQPAEKLRSAAFLCGSTLTGRKTVVAENLYALCARRVRIKEPCRILSIDLGVKNIGVCYLLADAKQSRALVESWHRASLPENLKFAYPEFSNAAIDTIKNLMTREPVDAVVIEKQRSRSSGSPMIPNGVLRVNVMEGMVFTALQTLFPTVHVESVSPKQIIDFSRETYSGQIAPSAHNRTPAQSYRESKKARRSLVQKWTENPVVAPVEFNSDVDVILNGKRDDMDDALVQALTWNQWRLNSKRLLQDLDAGKVPLEHLINEHETER